MQPPEVIFLSRLADRFHGLKRDLCDVFCVSTLIARKQHTARTALLAFGESSLQVLLLIDLNSKAVWPGMQAVTGSKQVCCMLQQGEHK
jgi:hypothetical protein